MEVKQVQYMYMDTLSYILIVKINYIYEDISVDA